MSSAFTETRNLYINYTQYVKPLSFTEWNSLPDLDHKVAVLFVQFYDEITLAWYKTKSFYTLEEDGVSTMNQYLLKNVPVIEANPSRFTSSYIYKVAYNCLYCICHDLKCTREIFENEVSNITECDGDELNLFDTVKDSPESTFTDAEKEEFWKVIANLGPEAEKVVEHLIDGKGLGRVRKTNPDYLTDPLAQVSVSINQIEGIVSQLRDSLQKFQDIAEHKVEEEAPLTRAEAAEFLSELRSLVRR